MKSSRTLFLGILLAASVLGVSAQATSIPSPATSDVLKLATAGVGDDVLLGFVRNEKAPFRMSTDDILALKDAKVGNEVIKAMLTHDVTWAPAAPQPVAQAPVAPPPPATVYLDPNPTPPVVVVPAYRYYPWHHHRPYYDRRGVLIWRW